VPGGLEAGRIIAEICLGGMGTVTINHSTYTDNWPFVSYCSYRKSGIGLPGQSICGLELVA